MVHIPVLLDMVTFLSKRNTFGDAWNNLRKQGFKARLQFSFLPQPCEFLFACSACGSVTSSPKRSAR